ncbi:MAG: hypothetical protein HY689_14535, partial [Chloroflexi bacterium]|nr:hypothetical protein [Chloroflexota bacterium]
TFLNAETPPDTYSSVSQPQADDTFTVAASAIPELPTPLAAVGSGLTAAAVYWWLRRRGRAEDVAA